MSNLCRFAAFIQPLRLLQSTQTWVLLGLKVMLGMTLAMLAQAQAIVHPNLVVNPGFETGDWTGWTFGGDSNFDGADTNAPYSGTFGAYFGNPSINSISAGHPSIYQDVATTIGAIYGLSFWYQVEPPLVTTPVDGSNNNLQVLLGSPPLSSGGAQTCTGNCVFQRNAGPVGYTQARMMFRATGETTRLAFLVFNEQTFTDLDDVSLKLLPLPPAPTTVAEDGQVKVSWDAVSDVNGDAVSRYEVSAYEAGHPTQKVGGCTTPVVVAPAPVPTSCVVGNLINQTPYVFTMEVFGSGDIGLLSQPSSAVKPFAPLLVSAPASVSGTVGQPFNLQLAISGGIGPFSWSIQGGSLPANIMFANGVFSGSPTQAFAASDLTLRVLDAGNSDSATNFQDVTIRLEVLKATVPAPEATAVTPVPTLSQWALVLLSLALARFAAMVIRRSRAC